jgi:tetratricopeptide (TPR) repeat protein
MATISDALLIAFHHYQAGRIGLAEEIYRRVLAAEPEHAEAYYRLGLILRRQGKSAEAVSVCRRALELQPGLLGAYNTLALALYEQGELSEGIDSLRAALQRDPRSAEAHLNLAVGIGLQGDLDGAVHHLRQSLEIEPDQADAEATLAGFYFQRGFLEDARYYYRQAILHQPDFYQAYSSYLCLLRYLPDTSAAQLRAAIDEYERLFSAPHRSAWPPHRRPNPLAPLRLGFVSPDFTHLPTTRFLIRPLEHLAPEQCEVVFYSETPPEGPFAARLESTTRRWRLLRGQADEQAAEQIRSDGIDVLFDLRGHPPTTACLPSPANRPHCKSLGSTRWVVPVCRRWTSYWRTGTSSRRARSGSIENLCYACPMGTSALSRRLRLPP